MSSSLRKTLGEISRSQQLAQGKDPLLCFSLDDLQSQRVPEYDSRLGFAISRQQLQSQSNQLGSLISLVKTISGFSHEEAVCFWSGALALGDHELVQLCEVDFGLFKDLIMSDSALVRACSVNALVNIAGRVYRWFTPNRVFDSWAELELHQQSVRLFCHMAFKTVIERVEDDDPGVVLAVFESLEQEFHDSPALLERLVRLGHLSNPKFAFPPRGSIRAVKLTTKLLLLLSLSGRENTRKVFCLSRLVEGMQFAESLRGGEELQLVCAECALELMQHDGQLVCAQLTNACTATALRLGNQPHQQPRALRILFGVLELTDAATDTWLVQCTLMATTSADLRRCGQYIIRRCQLDIDCITWLDDGQVSSAYICLAQKYLLHGPHRLPDRDSTFVQNAIEWKLETIQNAQLRTRFAWVVERAYCRHHEHNEELGHLLVEVLKTLTLFALSPACPNPVAARQAAVCALRERRQEIKQLIAIQYQADVVSRPQSVVDERLPPRPSPDLETRLSGEHDPLCVFVLVQRQGHHHYHTATCLLRVFNLTNLATGAFQIKCSGRGGLGSGEDWLFTAQDGLEAKGGVLQWKFMLEMNKDTSYCCFPCLALDFTITSDLFCYSLPEYVLPSWLWVLPLSSPLSSDFQTDWNSANNSSTYQVQLLQPLPLEEGSWQRFFHLQCFPAWQVVFATNRMAAFRCFGLGRVVSGHGHLPSGGGNLVYR
ncbi:hypothetical protein BASA81_002544 [Batrachochytrium salamandrivorans]|nr:hypothetical protein BASA81_002544 [Batrachochytrium salamandrivorans]